MTLSSRFFSIITPRVKKAGYELRRVGKYKTIKWALYSLEVVTIASAFGSIYDSLRLRVWNEVHCFAYGSATKCNFGIYMCFVGLMASMYAFATSVFEEYIKIPQKMKFVEAYLTAARFGLIMVTRRRLYKFHIKKMKLTYFTRPCYAEDLIMKITRFSQMIGIDLRNVQKKLVYANRIQIIILIVCEIERKEKLKNKERKKFQ